MADPQASQFWAPTPQGFDFSPLLRGAENLGAGLAAAGAAVGAGLQKAAENKRDADKEKKKDDASKEITELMDFVGDEKNYKTMDFTPALSDPRFAGKPLDEIRATLMADGISHGLSPAAASARAVKATSPVPMRIYAPGAEAKIRAKMSRAQVVASRAGLDPSMISQAVALSMQHAYANPGEAHQASIESYVSTIAPEKEALTTLEQSLLRDREKESDKRKMANEITMQGGAYDNAVRLRQLDAQLDEAKRRGDVIEQGKLIALKSKFAMIENEQQKNLTIEVNQDLYRVKGEMAEAVKQAGTPEEQAKASEFYDVFNSSVLSKQILEDPSLESIGGMINNSGIENTMPDGAQKKVAFVTALGNVGTKKDLSNLRVTIAPNGDAKIYDVTGALDQKKLDAAARKLFGNDLSMGALVLAKVYGGAGQSQNDLQMAFKVSRQTRMFDMARKFMAQNSTRMQGGASEEPTGNKPTASDLYNSGR